MLEVSHLTVVFDLPGRSVAAVEDVSFEIREGETLGLVGESGSGKSVTALAVMQLVQPPGRIAGGSIQFKGRELVALPEADMRALRGADIALIFQEPMTALNPVFTIGDQIAETLMVHGRATRRQALQTATDLLDAVRIPDPRARLSDYPHQLSGGMRQRVLIAMALTCRPSLLIADEPTTALDVTIQAQILDLLRRLREEYRLSVLFRAPRHPYTAGLLRSIPRRRPGEPRQRRLQAIPGSVPDLSLLPGGCSFHPRCPDVMNRCHGEDPGMTADAGGRVACFKYP